MATKDKWKIKAEQVERRVALLVTKGEYEKASAIAQFFKEETGLEIDPKRVLRQAGTDPLAPVSMENVQESEIPEPTPIPEQPEPIPMRKVRLEQPWGERDPVFKVSKAGHVSVYWPNQKWPMTLFVQNLEWLFYAAEESPLPRNLALLRDFLLENHHKLTRPTPDATKKPISEAMVAISA